MELLQRWAYNTITDSGLFKFKTIITWKTLYDNGKNHVETAVPLKPQQHIWDILQGVSSVGV